MTFTPDSTPYTIENGSGQNVLDQLNEVFGKIIANNSGTEPSQKVAYMFWADTASNPPVLKIRNSSNNGWVTLFQLDGTFTLEDGSNSAPGLSFRDDDNTGIFSSAADTLDVSCGGTTRGSFSSSGLAVTGNVSGTTFVGNIDAVDGDFDGTLEADAITVGGVALNTVIAGVTVTNATNATNSTTATTATNITAADESSDTTCFPLFVTAATGNLGPKTGSNLTFNSSTGVLGATKFSGDGSLLTNLPPGSNTYSTNLNFTNNAKLLLGGSSNLQIYSDGTHSFIYGDVGDLNLCADTGKDVIVQSGLTGNHLAQFNFEGAVELFYNGGTAKFQTTSTGVGITGNIEATGNVDLPNSSGSTEGRILLGTNDNLSLYYDGSLNKIETSGADIVIRGTGEDLAVFKDDGAVQLFHNGGSTPKLETTASGITVAGNIAVSDGNGIDFSDTANGVGSNHNEILDDYEEGLWTPVLRFGGSTSGISYTSVRGGSYTRIGRQVTVHFGFNLSDKGSQSGDATIGGLPFNPVSNIAGTAIEANGVSGFWNTVNSTANISTMVFIANDGDDVLDIRFTSGPRDQTDPMQASHFEDATEIRGSITYFVVHS